MGDKHEDLRPDRALTSQTLISQALVYLVFGDAVSMKKTLMLGNYGRGGYLQKKGWETMMGEQELEVEDHIFKLIWKDDAGGYLRRG